MSEAVILGSGTSNGVPMLGVEYPASFLANPKNHRTRCSLLLRGPTGNVLVDCAPEMRIQLVRERVPTLDAVIITHTHADHIMGMDDVRSYCIAQKAPMPVYTLPPYQEDIRRVFAYAFREYPPGIEVPRLDLRDVPEVIEAGGLQIETMVVEHGPVLVIALRVGDFAYVTDVSAIPPEARAKLNGLKTLVLDAVRFKPHPNHFHYERAVEVAAEIGAETTYFTHLSHDYDHDAFEQTMPERTRLAYDGLTITIG